MTDVLTATQRQLNMSRIRGRDTILDEVAHQRFDTPSKVIGGIEQRIRQRAEEAQGAFELVVRVAGQQVQNTGRALDRLLGDIQVHSRTSVALADRRVEQDLGAVRLHSTEQLRRASERSTDAMTIVRTRAQTQLAGVRSRLEANIGAVRLGAADALAKAGSAVRSNIDAVLAQSANRVEAASEATRRDIVDIGMLARQAVGTAADRTEALLREVAGQGPEKTLGRGFAVVRAADGRTLTRAADIGDAEAIQVQFNDGTVGARTSKGK